MSTPPGHSTAGAPDQSAVAQLRASTPAELPLRQSTSIGTDEPPAVGPARPSIESLKATATARQAPSPRAPPCAACRRALAHEERSFRGAFTQCEVAHNAEEFRRDFVWLHAQKRVYRVPREWAEREHPGGGGALSRGGCDANEAFYFHTDSGQATWKRFEVGYLVPCPADTGPWCAIA